MLNQIKSKLSEPKFQRQMAHVAGNVVSIIASAVIVSLVQNAVDIGIDKVMDKIQNVEESAA